MPCSRSTLSSEVLRSVFALRSAITSAQGVPYSPAGKRLGNCARNHDGPWFDRAARDARLAATNIHYGGRRSQHHARAKHRFGSDVNSLHNHAARPDERSVFNDHRLRLRRLEHPANSDAAREVDLLADLGTRTNGRPRIDHRPLVDVCTDVNEGRHHDDASPDIRPVACNRGGYATSSDRRIVALGRNLIEIRRRLAARVKRRLGKRPADGVRVEPAKVEEDSLLHPRMGDPRGAAWFADPQGSLVERGNDLVDRGAGRSSHAFWVAHQCLDARLQLPPLHILTSWEYKTANSSADSKGEPVPNSADVEKRINAIRCLSIDAVQKANSGHPGLPLGAAAMAYALWTRHLRYDPADPHWFNRDRFILSAGHGSMLLYSLLYLTGFGLTLDDLKSFRQLGSKTPGHPEYPHTPGVEATTGPLGQGIANAVGFAIAEAHLAAVYNRQERIVDHYTYVIAGDGDLMEGVSGEAGSLAGHLGLGKLIVMYDDNDVTLAGPTAVTFTEDQAKRYEAFGWHTQFIDVEHGNDVGVIDRAISAAKAETSRPSIILIRTHIGYGSPRHDTYLAHGEPLGAENVAKTKEFLGWPLEPPFFVPDDVLAWWRAEGARGRDVHAEWDKAYAAWSAANPDLAAQLDRMRSGRLPESLPWPTFTAENGSIATRDAGGAVMNAIAAELPELMGGSAGADPSTKDLPQGTPQGFRGRKLCRAQRAFPGYASTQWAPPPTASPCTARCFHSRLPSSTSSTT